MSYFVSVKIWMNSSSNTWFSSFPVSCIISFNFSSEISEFEIFEISFKDSNVRTPLLWISRVLKMKDGVSVWCFWIIEPSLHIWQITIKILQNLCFFHILRDQLCNPTLREKVLFFCTPRHHFLNFQEIFVSIIHTLWLDG